MLRTSGGSVRVTMIWRALRIVKGATLLVRHRPAILGLMLRCHKIVMNYN
jgi:hypothetical protein